MKVLLRCYFHDTVSLPDKNDTEKWNNITTGFEELCGFPNVIGAIDGSLIKIKR